MRKTTFNLKRRRSRHSPKGNRRKPNAEKRPISQDPKTGRWLKGNTERLVDGRRSRRMQLALLPGQEEVQAMLASRRARLHDDQGGTSELSQVLEDTLDRYQR